VQTPAPFDYERATSLAGAIASLERVGPDARVIAGGHSLLPMMKLRLAQPELVVDINDLTELSYIREEGGEILIGALTRHVDLLESELLADRFPVFGDAEEVIADPVVRNRGTIGGSLVHGDSASDLPTVLLACEGTVTVRGAGGATREIAATDLFQDYLTTTVGPDEVLTEVRVPAPDGWGHAYEKFARRAEDWAMVAVCALVRKAGDGSCEDVRIGLTNMGSTPLRATAAEQALRGQPLSAESIAAAAEQAAEGTDPPADLNATPDYKRHLARVLTRRALEEAVSV
jgi:aerobic carbon-monoxide dehydrogenase medium subunit